MKKLGCLLTVLLLLVSSLVPAVAEVKDITHWSWANGSVFTNTWELFVEKFPEYADVNYTFTSQGDSSQAMMKDVMLSYASGADLPDIIEMNFKLAPMLIDEGVVVDITDYVSQYADEVPEALWQSASKDGRMYGLPLRGNVSMMIYREDLCSEAGIDMTAVKTWEDFFAAGKKFQEYYSAKGEEVYWTNISPEKPCDYWGEIMFGQQDMGFFDENGECIVDTDPRAIEVLKTIYRIYTEGFSMLVADLSPSYYAALADGKIACILTAGWMPGIMQTNVKGATEGLWRIAPYPTFANGKQSMQGTMGYCIVSRDSEAAELAVRALCEVVFDPVLSYELNSRDANANLILNMYKEKPVEGEAIDLVNAYFGGQDVRGIQMEILENAVVHHYTPAFAEVLSILNAEMAMAISGQKTIDEAIADMGNTIRQQIGTSKY